MNNNKKLKIFFSGIAGSGMSAIAGFMADRGHIIAGSDRVFDSNPLHHLKKIFQSRGIAIVPQDGNGIDRSFDFAVFSTAVEPAYRAGRPDQPEFLKAKTLALAIKTRPEYLSEITASFKTIAVSGTSGKSTTSGMLAFMMNRLGLKPNFIGGGRVKQFKSPLNQGNYLAGNSDCLVIEACESDGTIVNYQPQHSIILNLSLDHHTVDKTAEMFKSLIENTSEKIILNADDKNLTDKITSKDAIAFSLHNPSHYKADDIVYRQLTTDFSLRGTKFSLSLPGRYNLYNAVSCIALLLEIGIPPAAVTDILREFNGIDRRFDIYLNDSRGFVIDDYAHNPHKISSLMETVRKLRERICYIFQPHGFGPTRLMKNEYIEAFIKNLRNTDHLVLLPIFYAGGTAGRDISSYDLADGIKAGGKSAEVVEIRTDIFKTVFPEYRSYVIFGARDETLAGLAKEIADAVLALK